MGRKRGFEGTGDCEPHNTAKKHGMMSDQNPDKGVAMKMDGPKKGVKGKSETRNTRKAT